MRYVKPRKPRGVKQNGEKSEDFCPGCYMRGCDPSGNSELYAGKIRNRLNAGLCPACGHNPCRCKSSLSVSTPRMVTHNNRKARREKV